ncbi:hypothetical protein FIBSPDRAFT_1050705 [Athelia psychrophila]|uniref:Uncharacterized protein n=1 Tax=Athelia psychrophila TaxID=1759441 RepID=A0A166AFU5_9AGAM|nr:hypothetical protein FIBSPDRAFT_1050705 [Fibularhizoctonia sp. CBS 109695]
MATSQYGQSVRIKQSEAVFYVYAHSPALPPRTATSAGMTKSNAATKPAPEASNSTNTPPILHYCAHVDSHPRALRSEDDIVQQLLELSRKADRTRSEISSVDYALYKSIQARVDVETPKLPIFYDVDSSSLIIDSLVSPAHESIQEFLCHHLFAGVNRWVQQSGPSCTRLKLSGAATSDMYSEGQLRTAGKVPSQSYKILIKGRARTTYPTMIFEIGYSEDYQHLLQDATCWLWESNSEVLCVILIKFFKPPQIQDFGDPQAWRACLEVYERGEHSRIITAFGSSIDFLPIRKPFPEFRLHLRHLFPADIISRLPEEELERKFEIVYDEEDIEDAIQMMESTKRARDKTEEEHGFMESPLVKTRK